MNRKQRREAAARSRRTAPRAGSADAIEGALAAGLQRHRAGDLAGAADVYRRALAVQSDDPRTLHLLGLALHQQGNHEAAVARLERAVALSTADHEARCNLAVALAMLGRLAEARGHLERATALAPDFPEGWSNLGKVLRLLGRPAMAADACRRALALRPGYAEALANLGEALQELGRLDEAAEACRRAIAADPHLADPHATLGTIHRAGGELDAAADSYRAALELRPGHAGALSGLALLNEECSRLDEARAFADQGLSVAPDDGVLNLVLARLERRAGEHDAAIARLERLPRAGSPVDQRKNICFELGRLYDRTGDPKRAFAAFAEGNACDAETARARGIDPATYHGEIEALSRVVTEEAVANWAEPGDHPATGSPIFLIGFPRSGTTLLDQILDSHPALATFEERPGVAAMKTRLALRPGGYPASLAFVDAEAAAELRLEYFTTMARFGAPEEGQLTVDKLPLNIAAVPLILRAFPRARFILALRHPCDVVLSCFMQPFGLNPAMANFTTLEGAAALYDGVMRLWRQYETVLAPRCHAVRYEDLVADFESETRRLLESIGVGWHDAVCDFHGHARARGRINTPSYHQVVQPIYGHASGRWRRYADRLGSVLDPLRPHAEAFGYEL